MSRADQVYNKHDQESLLVFLAVRDLLNRNRCTVEFGAEYIAELLVYERLLDAEPRIFDVEAALEALRVDGELHA
jgi:hypothetical protein